MVFDRQALTVAADLHRLAPLGAAAEGLQHLDSMSTPHREGELHPLAKIPLDGV
jgi:hypothetical protein